MAHYQLIVTNTDEFPVESQLEPYQESYEDFIGDNIEFNREVSLDRLNEFVLKKIKYYAKYLMDMSHDNPKDIKTMTGFVSSQIDKHVALLSKTTDEAAEFIHDYYGWVREGNNMGYYANPQGRFDFYLIGGRWEGEFELKNGKKVSVARKSDIKEKSLYTPPFALLHEGDWQEAPWDWEDEVGQDKWKQYYIKTIKSLPDDTQLTIVDYHS